MTYVVADRVKQKTTTAGTGTVALGASVTGFQTFASVCNTGDTFHYAMVHLTDGNWETGLGTINTSTGAVTRVPLTSSNNNTWVSFATGDKEIFLTPVSSNLLYKTDAGALGGSIIKNTTVDFGNTATTNETFLVTDAAAFPSSRFLLNANGSTVNGALGGDELEMDNFSISAYCVTTGTITMEVVSSNGPVIGKRNISYIIS